MTKLPLLALCLITGATVSVNAADDAARKKAMPPGHPAVDKPAATGGAMPAGHPDIPGGMPAGHPAVPGATGGAMPAGHPSMESLRKAATQPAKLSIHVVQGTKDGPAVKGESVAVTVYGEGMKVLKTLEAKLSEKGDAVVQFPVEALCQPVVRVIRSGLTYELPGELLEPASGANREQQLDLSVYEATEQPPQLSARIRHIIVHQHEDGLHITEMLAFTNPADRAWIGSETGGRRTTLTLPLAPGASDLHVANVPDGAVELKDGKFVSSLPVMPGNVEVQMTYILPMKDGKADIKIIAPTAVAQTFVFVPDDGSTLTTSGLDSLGVRQTGEGNKRGFKSGPMQAGQEASISFSGLKPTTAPSRKTASASRLPQIVAGVGGGVVLLGGVTFLLVKSPRKGDA